MPVAPQTVNQALGVGIKIQIVAGIIDFLVIFRQRHTTEALAVVIAVLQAQVGCADDNMVRIKGVFLDRVGSLHIQTPGAVGSICMGHTVGSLDTAVVFPAVMNHVNSFRGEQEEIIVRRICGNTIEGAMAAVAPAIIHNGVAGLEHGVKDPLEGTAIKLHNTGLRTVSERQVDIFKVVAADFLKVPVEGALNAPLFIDIGEGIHFHQVIPVFKILGVEDLGCIGGILQHKQLVSDPCHILQGSLGSIELGDRIGNTVIFPEITVKGIVQFLSPNSHIHICYSGGTGLHLLTVKDQQVVTVVVCLHQHKIAVPICGGKPDLIRRGRHSIQIAVVKIIRQHQIFIPSAAADTVFHILRIDQFQALALIFADIQAVTAGKHRSVFRNTGPGQPSVGLCTVPGIAPVIRIVQATHIAGSVKAVRIGGIDQRRNHGTATANTDIFIGILSPCDDRFIFCPQGRNGQHSHKNGHQQQCRQHFFHVFSSFYPLRNSLYGIFSKSATVFLCFSVHLCYTIDTTVCRQEGVDCNRTSRKPLNESGIWKPFSTSCKLPFPKKTYRSF